MFAKNFLSGKVALVTGSSRGIGRGIALTLADAGADIIVHYARKTSLAQSVVDEIQSLGGRAIAVKANFAEKEKIDAMLDHIEDIFGGVDIFVANAATGGFRSMLETSDKHWDWTMDVNARSILHCVQRLTPYMERRGWGRVVTVTSLGGVRVVPNYSTVGLSKSVVESLTRYLAAELAPQGIIVNAISPGLVDTDALANMDVNVQASLDYVRRRNPTRRLVTPQDVGRVAAFLCSEASEMIVGQTLYVDGGFSLLTDYFPALEAALQLDTSLEAR
ncbi:MAG TPA: SDR family oxidoreductase [Anaerolineales bacterium]|nr:SDR family oxidoreductase [Anaerolineales bacterium]